jgi:hypothetical protein
MKIYSLRVEIANVAVKDEEREDCERQGREEKEKKKKKRTSRQYRFMI